jgi:hypothetical protein
VNSFPEHAGIAVDRLKVSGSFNCDSLQWSAKKIVLDNNARLYLMSVPKINTGVVFLPSNSRVESWTRPCPRPDLEREEQTSAMVLQRQGDGPQIRVRLRVKSIVDREV